MLAIYLLLSSYEDFKEEFNRANPQLTFGKVILKARKEKGWSQKKAAELIEISPTYHLISSPYSRCLLQIT